MEQPTKSPTKLLGKASWHATRITRMEIIIVRTIYIVSRTSPGENSEVLFFLTFTYVDFRAACVAKADAVMQIRESFPLRVLVSAHRAHRLVCFLKHKNVSFIIKVKLCVGRSQTEGIEKIFF